ncbi:MAG: cupredoxin domain-containing protein [Chloroflexi bacterium]|nr:cupredoxin domain-containing protein [Chloroflexota bacterium]
MTQMRLQGLLRGTSLAVAIGLAIALGACSSSGSGGNPGPAGASSGAKPAVATPTPPGSSAGGTGQSSSAAAGGEINVTLKDNTFPKEIKVKAGAKVTFVVANKSDVEHSFEIPDFHVLFKIQPGGNSRFPWTVPDKKGKWDMGCYLTDPSEDLHKDMEGTLIIE